VPCKPTKQLKKTISATAEADQISTFVVDATALRHAVHDTVIETRGGFKDYRPGDIWKMLKGTVFQR